MERIKPKDKQYKVVSLFAGIGGLDLGFDFAGFDVIWANDFDKYACATYKENVGERIVCGDVRKLMGSIPAHDVLVGGFPCQPFSILGKLEGFNDQERGTLFFTIKEILRAHRTKVVVLENVKNLMSHDEGKTFARILRELGEIGYTCFYKVLNSQDYGVPQRRNRVFLIGLRREDFKELPAFDWPAAQELKLITQDLLDELVAPKYFLTEDMRATVLSEGTGGYSVAPSVDCAISKTLCATMHKMHRASQDNYVTDKKNAPEGRTELRRLTPNECRRLQGFPSDWRQVVSDTQAYKQFGNAVTVNVAFAVAEKLREYLNKYMTGAL